MPNVLIVSRFGQKRLLNALNFNVNVFLPGNRPRHHRPAALPAAPDARRCGPILYGEITDP